MQFTSSQEKVIQEAINWFYNSSEQTFEFCGEAGTGKSVCLREIITRLGLNENQYMSMAYTGQAAIIMRLKGFTNARSIHSSLYEFREEYNEFDNIDSVNSTFNRPVKTKKFVLKQSVSSDIVLFVIDEGYMVPKQMRRDIESFGIKVLVCGDDGQLPPVGGEPAYFTGDKVYRLTDLMRQAESSPIVYLAHRARRGQPIHCGVYGTECLVIEDKDLTRDLILALKNVICGTNATRDIMNKYIREDILNIHSDLPVYGDRVVCRNNNWSIEKDSISLANGLIGTVVNSPGVYGFDGNMFKIDFLPDLFPLVFDDISVNYNYYKADYKTRQDIKQNPYETGEMFELAYANTAYLTQGAEFSSGLYIEEFLRQNVQNQLNYTAITRFKRHMVYVKKSKQFTSFLV